MRIRDLLTERFINAVGNDEQAMATKAKYRDAVWDMLQRSYAPIGGIKGSGFESPEDMMNIPFWKIAVRDGVLRAVILYKDNYGRKSVAVGTDGSPEGSSFIEDVFRNDPSRSYSEKSKSALGKALKLIPRDRIEEYLSTPDEVQKVFPDKKIIALADLSKEDWPTDALFTINKYPFLIDYGYVRDLNGEFVFKVMTGTPYISIKTKKY